MRDRDFLMWIHARLTEAHGEDPCVDYMHKLRSVIRSTPEEQLSPNVYIDNNLADLEKALAR